MSVSESESELDDELEEELEEVEDVDSESLLDSDELLEELELPEELELDESEEEDDADEDDEAVSLAFPVIGICLAGVGVTCFALEGNIFLAIEFFVSFTVCLRVSFGVSVFFVSFAVEGAFSCGIDGFEGVLWSIFILATFASGRFTDVSFMSIRLL